MPLTSCPSSCKFPKKQTFAATRQSGFAIVVALSIMSLVLMLLLSLSILVDVEISAASGQEKRLLARQNALLGVNVALGNLQKQMGPDQRVSAGAALVKQEGNATLPAMADTDPRRHWSGVWDASGKSPGSTTSMTWVTDPNAELLTWLVSGSPDRLTDSTALPAAEIPVLGDTTLGSGGLPANDALAILVGPGSVGTSNVGNYVFAPKTKVESGRNTLVSSGAFAYWMADEARKAPLDLVDARYLGGAAAPSAYASRQSLMAPEKVGIGALAEWADYDLDNDETAEALNKALFRGETALADPTDGGDWAERVPKYFHDLGLSGQTVQVDVRNGGLKKDLNLLFELDDAAFNDSAYGGNPDTSRADHPPYDTPDVYTDEYLNGPVSYLFKQNVPESGANAFVRGPTWHFLRDYYRLYKDVRDSSNADSAPAITARAYRPNLRDHFDSSVAEDKERNGRLGTGAHSRSLVGVSLANTGADIDGNNSISTRSRQMDSYMNYDEPVQIPRLVTHEMAPVAVRVFYFFGFKRISMPDGIPRLDRHDSGDNEGEPIPRNGKYQWEMELTPGGDITAFFLQPMVVLWNPYNVPISFDAYKIMMDAPRLLFAFSWEETLSNGSTATRRYGAPLGTLFSSVGRAFTADGVRAGDFLDRLEFLVGNRPSGGGAPEPIILQPGQQMLFGPKDTVHLGDVTTGRDALFLEPGWNTSGGFAFYRTEDAYSRKPYESGYPDLNLENEDVDSNGVAQGKGVESDNIPAESTVTIDRVFWSKGRFDWSEVTASSVSFNFFDYLLSYEEEVEYLGAGADTDYILKGGDSVSKDGVLRSVGAADLSPNDVNDASGISISPEMIDNSTDQLYPFLAMEIRLNPADGDGFPAEMLGQTNPFAPLSLQQHTGHTLPDRHQIFTRVLGGGSDRDAIIPQRIPGTESTYFGYNYASSASTRTVLEEVPTMPLWSLGSMQHANISRYAYLPRNAIGNAQASLFMAGDDLDLVGTYAYDYNKQRQTLHDISYLSNESLFDSFFFSSLAPEDGEDIDARLDALVDEAAAEGRTPPLPNKRLQAIDDGRDSDLTAALIDSTGGLADLAYEKTAAFWAPNGGFNVNSVSTEAWKAFLSANLVRSFDYFDGNSMATGTTEGSLFSRYTLPNANATDRSDPQNDWDAPLSLNTAEIERLAGAIVDVVKARGPFLSMADFINRRPGSDSAEQQRQGALAQAIDAAGLNDLLRDRGQDVWVGDVSSALFKENTLGSTAAGIPGWLTQADLVTPLAPYISVRSDTFVIRVCGEAATGINGDMVRVWCEVHVQRVPDYVDSEANAAWDRGDQLNAVNAGFGRRFKIIRFRWLDQEDV